MFYSNKVLSTLHHAADIYKKTLTEVPVLTSLRSEPKKLSCKLFELIVKMWVLLLRL